MSDSLFSALRKYRKTEAIDPIENFITEGFAWLLRNTKALSDEFVDYLRLKLPDILPLTHSSPQWGTQHTFPGGQIDMLADFGSFVFIFEHKVWSSLAPGSLDKYKRYTEENPKWSHGYKQKQNKLILITGSARLHGQDPDLALTWSDIHKFLTLWLGKHSDQNLVRDFVDMLTQENLGPPAPVSYESMICHFPAQSLKKNLLNITSQAATLKDWNWVSQKIGFDKSIAIPRRPAKFEEGLVGFEVLDGQFLDINITTVLENKCIEPLNYHLGPDFCLILCFDSIKWKKFQTDFYASDEYTKLRSRLKTDSGEWNFLDSRFEPTTTTPWWLALCLRKSLSKVLEGTITLDEQVARLILHGTEAINLLLAGGELEHLTQRLYPLAKDPAITTTSTDDDVTS